MTIRLIKLAVLYLVLGMTIGIGMGISNDFLLRPVHAHVNLLGFAVLAVAAFVFHAFPDLARTRLATAWFWLYNIAMPVGLGAPGQGRVQHRQDREAQAPVAGAQTARP